MTVQVAFEVAPAFVNALACALAGCLFAALAYGGSRLLARVERGAAQPLTTYWSNDDDANDD